MPHLGCGGSGFDPHLPDYQIKTLAKKARNRMNTFTVELKNVNRGTSMTVEHDVNAVTISLESGKKLIIYAAHDVDILKCVGYGGTNMVAIYPKASNAFNIELK